MDREGVRLIFNDEERTLGLPHEYDVLNANHALDRIITGQFSLIAERSELQASEPPERDDIAKLERMQEKIASLGKTATELKDIMFENCRTFEEELEAVNEIAAIEAKARQQTTQ